METRMRRQDVDSDDLQPAEGNIWVELSRGAGGKREAEVPRSLLTPATTNDEAVRMALQRLNQDDPFVADAETMLDDRSVSLERIESGRQTRWVSREGRVDPASLEGQRLRYAMTRDHVGGR